MRGRNFLNGVRGAERTAPTYATIIVAEDRVRTWYNALQVRIQLGARSADRASSFDGAGGAGSSTVNR